MDGEVEGEGVMVRVADADRELLRVVAQQEGQLAFSLPQTAAHHASVNVRHEASSNAIQTTGAGVAVGAALTNEALVAELVMPADVAPLLNVEVKTALEPVSAARTVVWLVSAMVTAYVYTAVPAALFPEIVHDTILMLAAGTPI
jgi:hypothetical protein